MTFRRALPLLLLAFASCGDGLDVAEPAGTSRDALTGTWQTGASVGYGVAMMDTGNPLGNNVFIGYAGYNISLAQAESWAAALYDARLEGLGVRYVFAVQGPQDSGYAALEIGNSHIVSKLGALLAEPMGFILVAGHSSGSFVADELLQQLDTGADPYDALGSRLVYFDLDGDQKYVAASGINRLRRAWYVNAWDPVSNVASWNHGPMVSLGSTFGAKGGTLEYDASSSGCLAGGCVHISLISTKPHDAWGGSGVDYADFAGRPVNTWWLDQKRAEAGLGQCATPFVTKGAVRAKYVALGGCTSALGSPTSEPHAVAGGQQTSFEHGTLTLRPDGTVQVAIDGATPPVVDAGSVTPPPVAIVDAGTDVDAGTSAPPPPAGTTGSPPTVIAVGPLPEPDGVTGGCTTTGAPGSWLLLGLALAWPRRRR